MTSQQIATDLQDRLPTEILKSAFDTDPQAVISFSGAEDVVLIDMACNLTDQVRVFCLDTGRLHPETYLYIDKVRDFYGIDFDVLSPDAGMLQNLVKAKGLFSFYQDGHQECCSIRKIEPLRTYLADKHSWITGQRRDQSPTRAIVPQVQADLAFSTDDKVVTKYNPLANWSSTQVWRYIRDNEVPYNPLHDRGFISIGCQPCTRSTGPNQHEREGRWWWEEETRRECGLHVARQTDDAENFSQKRM